MYYGRWIPAEPLIVRGSLPGGYIRVAWKARRMPAKDCCARGKLPGFTSDRLTGDPDGHHGSRQGNTCERDQERLLTEEKKRVGP